MSKELWEACLDIAEWFYRQHPNEDASVAKLIAFANQQRAYVWREAATLIEDTPEMDRLYLVEHCERQARKLE